MASVSKHARPSSPACLPKGDEGAEEEEEEEMSEHQIPPGCITPSCAKGARVNIKMYSSSAALRMQHAVLSWDALARWPALWAHRARTMDTWTSSSIALSL